MVIQYLDLHSTGPTSKDEMFAGESYGKETSIFQSKGINYTVM